MIRKSQELLLTPHTSFDLGHEVVRQPQVIEGLSEGLGGVLRLAAIPCEALLRCAAATLSGFYVFFDGSCDEGHNVLLCFVRVSAGGRLSTHS
jgi:hypothetical protein